MMALMTIFLSSNVSAVTQRLNQTFGVYQLVTSVSEGTYGNYTYTSLSSYPTSRWINETFFNTFILSFNVSALPTVRSIDVAVVGLNLNDNTLESGDNITVSVHDVFENLYPIRMTDDYVDSRPTSTQFNQTPMDTLFFNSASSEYTFYQWNCTYAANKSLQNSFSNITLFFNTSSQKGNMELDDALRFAGARYTTSSQRLYLDINYTDYIEVKTPIITPSTAYSNDSLNCSAISEGGMATHTLNLTWYKNGVKNYTSSSNCANSATCYIGQLATPLTKGENWTCLGIANSSGLIAKPVNSSIKTIQALFPSIVIQNTFINRSVGHEFNVTAGVLGETIIATNYSITNGTCQNIANLTSGNYFNSTWNCTGNSLVSVNITIGFSDVSGNYVNATGTNTYPNHAQSFTEALKNQTATTSSTFIYDVNCSDADGDTMTYYDNTSLFNINSANGNITDTPTEDEQGNYTILITCGDGYVNTSQSFIYTINDTTPPRIQHQNKFTNASAKHTFNVTAGSFDYSNNIIKTNISVSSGTCQNLVNSTATNYFNSTWNCSGTALASTNIVIGFTDVWGNYNSTTSSTNACPNQLATVASAAINNTAAEDDHDLRCNNGSVSDADGDSTTLYYDWLKSSVSQGINSVNLSASHTTIGDIWQCRIWVGDTYQNSTNLTSASVSIATSNRAPIITRINATTISTGLPSTSFNPSNNNTQINLSVNYSDVNTGELHTSFFCKDTSVSAMGCANSWCTSAINSTESTLSCNFSVSGLTASSYTYCVAVLDNASLISSTVCDTFYVNHHPESPTFLTPVNATWTKYNNSLITLSSSDLDLDTINYTLWCNSTMQFSNTTSSWNLTDLIDGTHECKAMSVDQHNYGYYMNYSIEFYVDTTIPNITNYFLSAYQIYVDGALNLSFTCEDKGIGVNTSIAEYDIITPTGFTHASLNYNGSAFVASPTILGTTGTYNITNLYCYDNLSNVNNLSMLLTFTTLTRPGETGGGGGNTPQPTVINESTTIIVTSYCNNNGICDDNEDFIDCPQDGCKPGVKSILCNPFKDPLPGQPACIWRTRLMSTLVGLFGVGIFTFLTLSTEKKNKRVKKK
jgi:hypothetical protein